MTEPVQPCPRCGEHADEAGWCAVCGKNLLPDAPHPRFSKRSLERERLWDADPERARAEWRASHGEDAPAAGAVEESKSEPKPRSEPEPEPEPEPRPDPYATKPASGERWRYRATWMREEEEGDTQRVQEHLDAWGAAGWELVSANAVQLLFVQTDMAMPPRPYSTSVMRHYFYWRIRA